MKKSEEKLIIPQVQPRTRKYPFISFGVRVLLNIEALNMVETAGNLSRHRTVPIAILEKGNYSLRWFPALSGETLAHALQSHIADLYTEKTCYFCRIHEFIKHSALDYYEKLINNCKKSLAKNFPQWEVDLVQNFRNKHAWDIEKEIIKNCVVEDVGGFLVATAGREVTKMKKGEEEKEEKEEEEKEESVPKEGTAVRRTSAIQLSYAVPTIDAVKFGASTTDIQMQVRSASYSQEIATKISYEKTPLQAPFNKEIASSPYSFMINLDTDKIGVSSYTNEEVIDEDEKVQRIKVTLNAIKLLIDGNFGASKSRFHPFIDRELIFAAVSDGSIMFTVSSPSLEIKDFISETIERAISYMNEFNNVDISLYLWVNPAKVNDLLIDGKSIINFIEENFKNKVDIKGINDEECMAQTEVITRQNRVPKLKIIDTHYSHAKLFKEIEAYIDTLKEKGRKT